MCPGVISTTGIDLDKPLKWTGANADEEKLLQSLQGNILKGHGRPFTANIFFKFDKAKPIESRRVLRELANYHLTNAHRQLLDTKRYKETKQGGGPFSHLALSFKGYEALGLSNSAPNDNDFKLGMGAPASISALTDPPLNQWEQPFQQEIHGVLLAADETESKTEQLSGSFIELLEDAGCTIIHVQHGKALFNGSGEGIEHFGYVDGRSQPLMLVEDIEKESKNAGISRWDPSFPLKTALVKDPGTPDEFSFGSFFIFRKLEQQVRAFKTREQEIADILNLTGDDRELAGGMIVGRFEDGTPVTLSKEARGEVPPNDFNYEGDAGSRCPFHGHIRKANPRGSGGAEDPKDERKHLMARRGIPFEDVKRTVHPAGLPEAKDLNEFNTKVAPLLPVDGVGLLFMAYNHTIADQFKFTQKNWANNAGFPFQPGGPHGIDPVIGQGINNPGEQKLPKEWDNPAQGTNNTCSFAGFVKMKGGEYFFSPSLTFLKTL
jgi:Dyp-type peroxidase family